MLELHGISKCYKEKKALEDITLELNHGIYGLLGPNGAGKSTLMNIITANLMPSTGYVAWRGENIQKIARAYRSIIGYAPQQQGLYDTFSGRRFLAYMAALKGLRKENIIVEIDRVLLYVNMQEAADKKIGTYSGGMKQRILIAQALLGNPEIIILDEPTAGLDPKERVRIREAIANLGKEKIVLVSTHVVSDVETIANQIILLKSGQILDRDSVEGLCEKYHAASLEDVYMQIFGEEEYVAIHSI